MANFYIDNLSEKGIKAKVTNSLKLYSTYTAFAKASGYIESAVDDISEGDAKYSRLKEGSTVDVLAKGKHDIVRNNIYVIQDEKGEQFLLGEEGLEILTTSLLTNKLTEFTTMELAMEIRNRGYVEGYEEGVKYGVGGGLDEGFDDAKESAANPTRQQLRENIVERAKADVEKTEKMASYVGFIVNSEKRTVVALIFGMSSNKVIDRGIAKCHPDECFNAHIGKAISLRRALGLTVPSEYLNAPQPTGAQVGDVVRYRLISTGATDLVVVPSEKWAVGNECTVGSAAAKDGKIIDDSRE